jgi:hypothetical protein
MRIFVAGIMQGSRPDEGIHHQTYRRDIARILRSKWATAEILDPWALHPQSVGYDDQRGRETLLAMAQEAGQADLVVAYVPQATMGTAVEMWEAYRRGKPIITISPLTSNWVVKFLSTTVVNDLEEFSRLISDEVRLAEILGDRT